jgi:short-subunit dehydrogenase
LSLAAQGAAVCLVGRSLEKLHRVAESALVKASRIAIYRADLSIDEDIRELKKRLEGDFPSIEVLIHSAGVISMGSTASAPVEEFDWQYHVNLRAPYLLTQSLLPMLRQGQGQIVFINSLVGLNAKGAAGQYSATKHALKALADSLREEVNADGLRVLSVFLGRTASPMQAAVHRMEGRTHKPERLVRPNDVADVVLSVLSLAHTAEATDITIRHSLKAG